MTEPNSDRMWPMTSDDAPGVEGNRETYAIMIRRIAITADHGLNPMASRS